MPTTTFVWDPVNDCVISELDGTGTTQAVYTNEPQQYGGVLSQRRGSTSRFLHADALGTTRLLTSTAGAATDTYLFDAWGNPVSSTGSTVNPFRWVGRSGYYTDSATALVYVRGRMYQPTIARWCSDELILIGPPTYDPPLRPSKDPGFPITPPFVPPLREPNIVLPPWVYPDPPLPEQFPVCDPLCKIELCQDKTTWDKNDCPCPCRFTKIGQAPVSDQIYRDEFQKALESLGVSINVMVDVKDICIPGKPGISVTCPANLTKTGKLYVCLAKYNYNNCDAAALALHEAFHVLQIQDNLKGGERPAYTKQCIALYEQYCCDSPCPDSRGCYGPPFMDPPRKPNDPIPDKQTLIDGCVRKLMPQSTGPANQQAFEQFCKQN